MIRIAEPNIGKAEEIAVMNAVRSNQLSGASPIVLQFEKAFAKKTKRKYAVAVNSGSSALLVSLYALKPKHIIIPDFCYIAIPNSVHVLGIPFTLRDVDGKGNISGPNTLAVHTYGHRFKGKCLIEDAAEAVGLQTNSGRVTCFSFFGNKTMTTGEGGMITTDDKKLYKKMLEIRENGNGRRGILRYYHDQIGFGMRMGGLQAALGLAQLERLDEFLAKKKEIVRNYDDLLVDMPVECFGGQWMYGILAKDFKERNALMEHLEKRGIETRNFFPPVHTQKPYKTKSRSVKGMPRTPRPFPRSTELGERGLYLPSGTSLTLAEQETIVEKIAEFYLDL